MKMKLVFIVRLLWFVGVVAWLALLLIQMTIAAVGGGPDWTVRIPFNTLGEGPVELVSLVVLIALSPLIGRCRT